MTHLGLVHDIERARSRFLALFDGISQQEASTPIGEGRWSPLQYLEHLVLAEEATVWRMFKAVEDARASRELMESPTPGASIEEIVDRTWETREQAPPLAVPRLGGSLRYWRARMERNAALVAEFGALVRESELDTIAYPHPISGPFTMRQGLQFIRFHLDRHGGQLTEARGSRAGGEG